MPAISVLMPVYNCEKYVAEAIDSVLNQTFPDWELIIVDDGSSDNTRQVVDEYDDHRIRREHNETRVGVVHARNKLLRLAKGDLITWLDGDDISYNNRLEKLAEVFDKRADLDLCGSNSDRRYKLSRKLLMTNHPLTHEAVRSAIEEARTIPFSGASVAFRKKILETIPEYRPFFNRGGGDPDFLLRVSEKYCVGNVPDVLYRYRYTRNSVSRTFSEDYYLRPYLREIFFFLADQRARYAGLDGLMEGGNKKEFDEFLSSLRRKFEADRSVVYRHACQNKINNQDYVFAFLDALRAIHSNPVVSANYRLLGRVGGSFVKTVFRMMAQRKRNSPANQPSP